MVELTTGFDGLDILPLIPVSLDSMLLIPGLAGFNVFFVSNMQAFGFFPGRLSSSWPLPGQNVFLVFIQVSVPR